MTTGIFEAGGLVRASSAAALQTFLRRQRGINGADANPVSQTVTVLYDEASISSENVRALIERFGCTCGGEVVPCRLCLDEQPAVTDGGDRSSWACKRELRPGVGNGFAWRKVRDWWRAGRMSAPVCA